MFTDDAKLKKLMKDAYKGGGLIVANNGESYYLSGGYWELEVRREFITNKILAQIIELAGEIPDVGERFSATKDGNQMEIGKMKVDVKYEHGAVELTDVILLAKTGVPQRILQNVFGKIYLMNEVFIQMISNAYLDDENGEYEYMGPFCDGQHMVWVNNVMHFRAGLRWDDGNKGLIANLERVNLSRAAAGDLPEALSEDE